MIARIAFALASLVILGALLYLTQADNGSTDTNTADSNPAEPGYVATQAQLVETGEDGHPLYRLDAARIEQPQPQGLIYLTGPKLDYQPTAGNDWTLSADSGQLPQDATYADFFGNVHAEGKPAASGQLMQIDADQLHLDMVQKIASTQTGVRVHWSGYQLRARIMRADLKNEQLQMSGDGYASTQR